MKYTSSEANKLLKSIESQIETIACKEDISSSFLVASGEEVESLRPEYNYSETQGKIDELEAKARLIKHTINTFNITHTLPGFEELTIDQALVYIPQLSKRVNKYLNMSSILPKQRVENYNKNYIDYRYANYDIEEAEKDYNETKNLLHSLQLALDKVNCSETMDIDIEL